MCFLLYRFYGKNSSYVHGGLDSNGKPADAVYGQEEIHKKLMSQNFTNCHIKIYHVDGEATLNGGIVVQVMGTLSNNNQAERSFMQTFVLAPQGSVGNKFYVYNDIFRYQDEIWGLVTEPQEESEKKVGKPDEKQLTPELEPDNSANLNDQNISKDLQENLEKPDMKLEPKPEPLPDIKEDKPEPAPEKGASEDVQKSTSSAPGDVAPAQKDLKAVTWAEVVSKNLPPKGAVPVKQTLPHLLKVPPSQGRRRPIYEGSESLFVFEVHKVGEPGDVKHQRMVRHPDSHQLFIRNLPHEADKSELKALFQNYGNVLELRILSGGGNAPNFGFVVFDDSEPVQKVLKNRPIILRGAYPLNVEEKKSQAAREGNSKTIAFRDQEDPMECRVVE
ncbi:ras GTPase-activating protein-binding 1 [Sigmodon hispidus]